MIVLLAIILLFIIIEKNKNVIEYDDSIVEEKKKEQNIKQVESPIMYFTVRSCVEKYISYLSNNDFETIYKLLDNEYKEKFSITKKNIQKYIETAYEDNNLKIEKMYVQEIDENNEKYYVKATLIEMIGGEETIYGGQKEFIVTVNIDHESMTFSIVPFGYGGVFYEQ